VCRADVGIATTGVAGPDPQDGRPVGTVYVAVAGDGSVEAEQCELAGGRAQIQRSSTVAALQTDAPSSRYADAKLTGQQKIPHSRMNRLSAWHVLK